MSNVRDIDQAEFGQAVLQRSNEVPVVVDFWAAWCGPCRTLGPMLEKLADDYDGAFELVKIDVDSNTELSAQFGVQSIPYVLAFKDGQPVSQFVGALPEAAIKSWLDELMPSDADRASDEARDLALEGDSEAAEAAYRAILEETPDHPEAAPALASLLIARGATDEALIVLGKLPRTSEIEQLEAAARVTAAQTSDVGTIEAELAADPQNHKTRLELGQALAAKGEHEPALDHLLAVVRSDDPARDDARQAMLDVFGVLGSDHPLTGQYRRQLANELF